MKAVLFQDEKQELRDFLDLPKRLYKKGENTENTKTVKALMLGKHPLSKYFTIYKWLIYDNAGKAVGRFAITVYKDDPTAYLGFYECIEDDRVAKFLFDTASSFAKKMGYMTLVGPVDASFWIKYRLKINKWEKPYTGEPYNMPYYYDQFKLGGFTVCDHYTSQLYEAPDDDTVKELAKFDERLKEFSANGYEIRSPKKSEFNRVIDELYDLITELYADFPVYKGLSLEDWRLVFGDLKMIVDPTMSKMAYYDGEAVGFYVTVADYGNLVYHTNLLNIIRILNRKKKPKRYIMLYMGVDPAHRGLGKAIVGSVIRELSVTKLPSIGALAHDGKLTQNYAEEKIASRFEYVLLKKDL